jgi:hypothetical protein
MQTTTLSEFLTVVLSRVADKKGGEERLLPHNPRVLHKAFFTVRERYQDAFPFLRELHFITAGAFPYSPDLTETLDLLQASGSISRTNPSFERFMIKTDADTKEWVDQEAARVVAGDEAKSRAFNEMVEELAAGLLP